MNALSCRRNRGLTGPANGVREPEPRHANSAVDARRADRITQVHVRARRDPPAAAPAPVPTGRVLVIDDEPNVASFVGRALRAKGFAVDVALGGERGLDAALDGGHALIVLDLRMRDVNGLVILRQVMRRRPEQRVLVLSAAADVDVKVRCLELGAADFVAKPFELAELVARVGAHLRRSTPPAPEAERHLRAGLLTLDLVRHCVDLGTGGRSSCPSASSGCCATRWRAPAARARARSCSPTCGRSTSTRTPTSSTSTSTACATSSAAGVIRTVRNLGYVLEP